MDYCGNRIFCKECTYFFSNCKMVDNINIKILPSLFGTDQDGHGFTNICYYFVPKSWDNSLQKEWKGIKKYYEFINDWYGNKGLKHKTVTLITGEGRWGDFVYKVSLDNWLEGNVYKEDGSLNYKYAYKTIKTKKNKRPIRLEELN